jgi:pantoate--beta-alanine ligase
MHILHTAEETRAARTALTRAGQSLALVPTMGALHEGHLALAAQGKKHATQVWVTIFVNPTQFGPNEDFTKYPRTLEDDLAKCQAAGVDAVFVPEVATMYPPNGIEAQLTVPSLARDLEATFRPTHFAGVCRVVAKLLALTLPDVAIFGKKDYQQLRVVEALTADLLLPTRILAHPTVYEADGLAKSSRNRYLSPEERGRALGISRALSACEKLAKAGETRCAVLEDAMARTLAEQGLVIDYATIRDRRTLAPREVLVPGASVALITARCGNTRLLDNREL